MFLKFFGFREQPFGVTPDPRFLYLSSAHREALASLIYGIESDLGFLALIAKPGMGKTTASVPFCSIYWRSLRHAPRSYSRRSAPLTRPDSLYQ